MSDVFFYCLAWWLLAISAADTVRLVALRGRLPNFQQGAAVLHQACESAEIPAPNIGVAAADRLLSSKSMLFVSYSYTFAAKAYDGARVYPDEISWLVMPGRIKHTKRSAIRVALKGDRTVPVFVNPRNPTEAFLSNALGPWTISIGLVVGILCLVGLGLSSDVVDARSPLGVVATLASSTLGIVFGPRIMPLQVKWCRERAVEL